ncbi:MAG: RT0821/Lpp0805 family surface protein [Bacteroidota bacterium]
MRAIPAVVALAACLGVAGCGPDGPSKADTGTVVGAVAGGILGNQVGRGSGRVAATMVGAVVGGIVGHEIGRSLDREDRRLAQEAEFEALERGPSGVGRPWRNPDSGHYGEIIPEESYRRGSMDCRRYTHTIYIDGRPQTMRGTACRNPDGTWRSVA